MSDKIKKIGYSLPGGSGSGDMTQAVYDPAGKAEQVLTLTNNPQSGFDTTIPNPAHTEGVLFYDNTKKALSYYNEESEVTVNIGRELLIRVINNSGSTITNGSVVYPAGVSSDLPEIELATANEEGKSKVVGVVTQDIANGATGYVTKFGEVNDIDTSGFNVGDIIYLSDTAGEFTNIKPSGGSFVTTIGVVEVVDSTNGRIIVDIVPSQLAVEVTDANGFPTDQRTGTTISFVDVTRTFTITPTGSDFHFYENGQKYEKTAAENVVIDNTEGLHVIYYDDGVLTSMNNPTDSQIDTLIRTKPLVAYVYWNATDSVSNYVADERHGISMSPDTHAYLHFTRGSQFLSGFALNALSVDQSGNDDTHAQFGVDSGMYTDEDLPLMASAVLSTAGLPIYYLDGASANLRRTTKAGFSVLDDVTAGVGVTGRLVYNEFTGVTWQLTTVNNNDFVLCHVFAINGVDGSDKVIAVIGQEEYPSLSTARAGAETELSNLLLTIPAPEIIAIATLIFQTSDGDSNAVKACIRSTEDGDDYIDWRTSEIMAGAAPTSHNNLANLQLAQSGVTYGHINDKAQTIAGAKTFSGGVSTESIFADDGESEVIGIDNINKKVDISRGTVDSPVNHWKLQETSGTDVVDSGTAAGNLTNTNAVIDQTGKIDKAYDFNGSNQYLESSTARNDAVGSWAAWVYREGSGFFQSLYSSADKATNVYNFNIASSTGNKLTLFVRNNTVLSYLESTNDIPLNTWSHLVVTSNGATTKMYINGVEEIVTITSGVNDGSWMSDVVNRDNTCIGRTNRSTATDYFEGLMEDVRLYDRALTEDEINAIYNEGSGTLDTKADLLSGLALDVIGIVDAESYTINDTDINTGGTLSNVAYLDQENIFTKTQIIRGDGALRLETATADSTNKYGRILVGHYLNAEEPFLPFSGGSLNGNNIAFIGGTSSSYNTATQVRFYTASNYTTLTGTERMRLDSSGQLIIGNDTALSRLDVSDGGLGVTIGADSLSTTRTDTTNKNARIGFAHYTNAEEPFSALVGISNSTDNILYIGGGSSIQNSATSIRFYTYTTNAQTTGTERMRIDGDGDVAIGTSTPTSPSSFSRFLNIHGTTDASLELSGSSLTASWTLGATANGFQIRDDGTEKFTIDTSGDAWFIGDVSALSFTDRTPYPESTELAIEAVKSVQRIPKGYDKNNKEKQLDHDKLHPFLRGSGKNPSRDMSANISCNTEVIKYLLDVIDGLNKDIDLLYRQKGEVRPSQQHKPKNIFKRIFT